MEFKRARSEVQVRERKEEIMKATKKLLDTYGLDGFNINSISEMTSINRASFYTYYKTKEEVLLDVLKEELSQWDQELNSIIEKKYSQKFSVESFAKFFARNITQKKRVVQLFSLAFTTLEENSRVENIAEYKKTAIPVLTTMKKLFSMSISPLDDKKSAILVSQVTTFLVGLYPMSNMTKKQKEALELCGLKYVEPDFEKILYSALIAFIKEAL